MNVVPHNDFFARLVTLVLAIAVVGCTTGSVSPAPSPPSPVTTRVLVIGDVTMPARTHFSSSAPSWDSLRLDFETGVNRWIYENHRSHWSVITDSRLAVDPRLAPPDAVVLAGTITKLDRGNEVLMALVGFGAGRARVSGDFDVRGSGGITLFRFSASESYLGGIGFRGPDFRGLDGVVRRLGERVAKEVIERTQPRSGQRPS